MKYLNNILRNLKNEVFGAFTKLLPDLFESGTKRLDLINKVNRQSIDGDRSDFFLFN